MTKTRRQEALRAAANLAAETGGTARGNVVELRPWTDARPAPPKPRRPSLKAVVGDVAWCGQRHRDLTPEGVYVKKLSENLRHDLKKFYKENK